MKSPGNDLKVQLDLAAAFKIMNQRRRGYEDGKAYYDGDVAEMAAGNRQVARILQRSAEAHKLTFANIPVDALFDKIALATISSDGAGKEFLANIMDDADLLDEASDWNIKAGYFGDYYVVLDADEQDDNGEDDDGIPLPGAIKSWRPIGSSPLSTVAVYSPKDQSEVLYFVKRWQIGDHWEACVYYDDATVAMQTGLNTKNQGDNSKVYVPSLMTDENGEPIEGSHIVTHLGGMPLAFHIAVDGKPYGKPVHRGAYGPQDAINKIHATYLATVETIGFPMRYGLQDPKAAMEDDDLEEDFGRDGLNGGGFDATHPATGTGADGQLSVAGGSKLKATPGGFWSLRGFASVGQFPSADQAGFFKSLDWEVRAMSTATGTPFYEFDETGTPPSGASRRLANGRINKHADKVVRQLTQAYITFGETLLAASGIAYTSVTVDFDPTETETDEDGMSLVEQKVKNGVPINRALREAGYPADDVDQWWDPKDLALVPPQLYLLLGDFLRFASQAAAAELVAPSEVAKMLPNYLTEKRDAAFLAPKTAPPPFLAQQTLAADAAAGVVAVPAEAKAAMPAAPAPMPPAAKPAPVAPKK
jgi:hypothetical protein